MEPVPRPSLCAPEVVTFGEAMVMFVAEEVGSLETVERFRKYVAGADSNVAIGLARMGFKAGWVSRLGNDSLGRFILARLASEGVDCSRVCIDPTHGTGFQLKERSASFGDPSLEYHRRHSAASQMSCGDFDRDYFLGARHLHATGIPPALSEETRELSRHAVAQMRARGRTVSFDPNLRPSLWSNPDQMIREVNRIAVGANWVMPGLAEGRLLTGFEDPADIASFYLDSGVELVAIKLGPAGSYFRTRSESGLVAAFEVENVTDTVGAGDAFAVGLVSGLLDGCTVEHAVRRGNFFGAKAIQSIGDNEGLPYRGSVEAFEASQRSSAA